MSKTGTIVIGLATALAVLGVAAPRPAYAQTVLLDALGGGGQRAGQVITVGTNVNLSASVSEYPGGLPAGWTLTISCKGQNKTRWTDMGCTGYPCRRGVFSNVPGTWTCVAQLYRGAGWAVLRKSLTLTYGGAATGAYQVTLEVLNAHVTVNFRIAGGTPPTANGISRCYRGFECSPPALNPFRASWDPSNPPNWVLPARGVTTVNANAWTNAPVPAGWFVAIVNGPGNACVGPQGCSAVIGKTGSVNELSATVCRTSDGICMVNNGVSATVSVGWQQ